MFVPRVLHGNCGGGESEVQSPKSTVWTSEHTLFQVSSSLFYGAPHSPPRSQARRLQVICAPLHLMLFWTIPPTVMVASSDRRPRQPLLGLMVSRETKEHSVSVRRSHRHVLTLHFGKLCHVAPRSLYHLNLSLRMASDWEALCCCGVHGDTGHSPEGPADHVAPLLNASSSFPVLTA